MADNDTLRSIAVTGLEQSGVKLDASATALLGDLIANHAAATLKRDAPQQQQQQQQQQQEQQNDGYGQQQQPYGRGRYGADIDYDRYRSAITRLGIEIQRNGGGKVADAGIVRSALDRLCPGFWPFC